jgi:hypothetical protein
MFWDRILGSIPPNMNNNDKKCVQYLDPVLKLLNINGMIVGHTPQYFSNQHGINSTCGNRLYRVDHGGSEAFYKFDNQLKDNGQMADMRKAQVLEITNDKNMKVLKM